MWRSLAARLLTYAQISYGPLHRNDREGAFTRAWGYLFTNGIVGDYYEFGVAAGHSLCTAYLTYQPFLRWLTTSPHPATVRDAHPIRFIGLDTFTGLPPNQEGDPTFPAGAFACPRPRVEARCARIGLRAPQLRLVAGLFADTTALVQHLRPAALVNLDCDLYASACDALEALTPLIQQGTILLCDDYDCFRSRRDAGERLALTEWSARTGIVLEPWFAYQFVGRALICHRDRGHFATQPVLPAPDSLT